jgi:hypothetical protein
MFSYKNINHYELYEKREIKLAQEIVPFQNKSIEAFKESAM